MSLRLPGHLFHTYSAYKSGTRDVIEWLVQINGVGYDCQYVDSIRQLEHLTDVAVQKNVLVPPKILRILRKTINSRTKISHYFKKISNAKHEQSNSSHHFFNIILLNVYERLHGQMDMCSGTSLDCECISPSQPANKFMWLECYTPPEPPEDEHCDVLQQRGLPPTDNNLKSKKLEDTPHHDIIDETMAVTMYLAQLDKLFSTVQDSWKRAASGSIPVIAASFTTSISYQATETLQEHLDGYDIRDPEKLLFRYNYCMESLECDRPQPLPYINEDAPFTIAAELEESWHALQDFKRTWNSESAVFREPCSCCGGQKDAPQRCSPYPPHDNLKDHFQSCQIGELICITSTRKHLDLVLERMGQLIRFGLRAGNRLPLRYPLLEEVILFLRDTGATSTRSREALEPTFNAIGLSFGLLLLVESCKMAVQPLELPRFSLPDTKTSTTTLPPSRDFDHDLKSHYISMNDAPPSPPPSPKSVFKLEAKLPRPTNYRLSSLKFASDIQKNIKMLCEDANAPCGCLEINKSKVLVQLTNYHYTLHQFITTKNFDIFHQSPWVSGFHMLQTLRRASEYGLKSWHHGYFVGTLLHLYNSLVSLGALRRDQIPVMESICGLFEDTVFMGQVPQRNFLSSYQRWLGGKLNISGKHCHGMHDHSNNRRSSTGKKWTMECQRDVSQGGDSERRRFDPANISLLFLIISKNSITDDEVLRFYKPATTKKGLARDIKHAQRLLNTTPFIANHISAIQSAIVQEFDDSLPVAKINHFKLYTTFCDILRRISDAEHTKKIEDGKAGYALHEERNICSCISHRLLSVADKQREDVHYAKTMEERELVRIAGKTLLECLGGKELKDFVWDM